MKSNLNHQNDKNKYLTIFNNNISNPARNEKTILENRKEITFNMHLSSIKKIVLSYCVIFFDGNKEKIEAKWSNKTISKNIKNLDGSAKVPENAETYKIAVKFPNDFLGELNVDYFFSVIQ